MPPNICMVIDVSNVTCRAYHSVATGKQGQSVIGLARYRLNQMIEVLLRDVDPLRLIGALDCGPSFRHELFPAYKAHRGEKPAELSRLLEEAPALLSGKHGAELFRSPGFEADDILATIADANLSALWRTLLVTNDMDASQLAFEAGDKTGTYLLHYKAGDYFSVSPKEVQDKLGVPPHRVALYKALAGDASDGLKGIEGIGPVAARRLAHQYASMQDIFQNLGRLQSSDRKKLEGAGLEYALMMEELTTLRHDIPLVVC